MDDRRGAMDEGRAAMDEAAESTVAGRRSALDDGRPQGPFDLSIQLAVREMLDVEPPAGLRRRIMAQLSNSVASASLLNSVASALRRKDLVRRKTLWIPVAAAATLVMAVMLWSRSTAPIQPPTLARAADRNLPAKAPQPQTIRSAAPKLSAARVAAVQHRSRGDEPSPPIGARAMAVAFPTANGTSSNIEALAAIAPISVTPVRPSDITPPEVTVAPLAPIPAIQVAPLFPPERRN